MINVIDEPKLVQQLNEEYFRLINFYSNVKRTANFIKYYNLALEESPSKSITQETYDYYMKTQNRWDVYDLTPMTVIGAIQNTPELNQDLRGNMIVSATTISTYTIENPRIGDLVCFYKPAESEEVLRVISVRLQLNSLYSTEPVKYYELDLESAPIKNEHLDQLLKNNHYVYDLTIEKNVKYEFYKEYVSKMKELENLLTKLKKLYLSTKDMYVYKDEIIVELNELLYLIKKQFDNKYHRLFEKIYSPFGYWDHYGCKVNSISSLDFDQTQTFTLRNFRNNKEREYNLSSRLDDPHLNQILKDSIELLRYSKEIEVYLGHTNHLNTENI